MDKMQETFAGRFKPWGIELPDPVPERGEIAQGGWIIKYILVPDEQGQPCLEFVANHRMTNQRHERILSSGERVSLPEFQEGYGYDPNIPGDREAAEARMRAHNQALMEDLISKGLL